MLDIVMKILELFWMLLKYLGRLFIMCFEYGTKRFFAPYVYAFWWFVWVCIVVVISYI